MPRTRTLYAPLLWTLVLALAGCKGGPEGVAEVAGPMLFQNLAPHRAGPSTDPAEIRVGPSYLKVQSWTRESRVFAQVLSERGEVLDLPVEWSTVSPGLTVDESGVVGITDALRSGTITASYGDLEPQTIEFERPRDPDSGTAAEPRSWDCESVYQAMGATHYSIVEDEIDRFAGFWWTGPQTNKYLWITGNCTVETNLRGRSSVEVFTLSNGLNLREMDPTNGQLLPPGNDARAVVQTMFGYWSEADWEIRLSNSDAPSAIRVTFRGDGVESQQIMFRTRPRDREIIDEEHVPAGRLDCDYSEIRTGTNSAPFPLHVTPVNLPEGDEQAFVWATSPATLLRQALQPDGIEEERETAWFVSRDDPGAVEIQVRHPEGAGSCAVQVEDSGEVVEDEGPAEFDWSGNTHWAWTRTESWPPNTGVVDEDERRRSAAAAAAGLVGNRRSAVEENIWGLWTTEIGGVEHALWFHADGIFEMRQASAPGAVQAGLFTVSGRNANSMNLSIRAESPGGDAEQTQIHAAISEGGTLITTAPHDVIWTRAEPR